MAVKTTGNRHQWGIKVSIYIYIYVVIVNDMQSVFCRKLSQTHVSFICWTRWVEHMIWWNWWASDDYRNTVWRSLAANLVIWCSTTHSVTGFICNSFANDYSEALKFEVELVMSEMVFRCITYNTITIIFLFTIKKTFCSAGYVAFEK